MLQSLGDVPAAGRPGLAHQLVPGCDEVSGREHIELADDLVQLVPRSSAQSSGGQSNVAVGWRCNRVRTRPRAPLVPRSTQQPPITVRQSTTNVCRSRSGSSQAVSVHSTERSRCTTSVPWQWSTSKPTFRTTAHGVVVTAGTDRMPHCAGRVGDCFRGQPRFLGMARVRRAGFLASSWPRSPWPSAGVRRSRCIAVAWLPRCWPAARSTGRAMRRPVRRSGARCARSPWHRSGRSASPGARRGIGPDPAAHRTSESISASAMASSWRRRRPTRRPRPGRGTGAPGPRPARAWSRGRAHRRAPAAPRRSRDRAA